MSAVPPKEWGKKITKEIQLTSCLLEMQKGKYCSKRDSLAENGGENKWDQGYIRQHNHMPCFISN